MVFAEPGGLFALSVREGAEVVPRRAIFGDLEIYIGTESSLPTTVFGTSTKSATALSE